MSRFRSILLMVGISLTLTWLAEETLRVAIYAAQTWGPAALVTDPIVWYKLGEGLILGSLVWTLLSFRPLDVEGRRAYLRRARWVSWAGVALTLLAYLNLRSRMVVTAVNLGLPLLGLAWPALLHAAAGPRSKWARGLALLAALLFYLFTYAQAWLLTGYAFAPLVASKPAPASTQAERWQQDLTFLAGELPRMHLNAFHTTSQQDFQAAVETLKQSLPNANEDEVLTGFMRLGALVGDAHSGVPLWAMTQTHRYPLILYWFRDGWYVIAAAPEYQELLGARLVQIGENSIEAAVAALTPLINHENEAWLRDQLPQYLVSPEVLHGVKLIPSRSQGEFGFITTEGEKRTVAPAPIEKKVRVDWKFASQEQPFYQQEPGKDFWYQYLPETRTIYFKYNACTDAVGFRRITSELFETAGRQPVERIILDLRDNSGGNSTQFRPFLDGIKARPEWNQKGRLFVIIGRGTFSSAMLNAIEMRQQTQAILIGEPTGGKPNSYGEVRNFYLPNSHWMVRYTTKYFQESTEDLPAVLPDVTVEPTFTDYLAGRDPVYDAILAYQP